MQSVASIDDYRLHSTKLLGVCARGDTGAYSIGTKRVKSGGSVCVLALSHTSNLGSDTHDWPLISNKFRLSFAADSLSTGAGRVAAMEGKEKIQSARLDCLGYSIARLLRADILSVFATRDRQGRSNGVDVYGLYKARSLVLPYYLHSIFCDQSKKHESCCHQRHDRKLQYQVRSSGWRGDF